MNEPPYSNSDSDSYSPAYPSFDTIVAHVCPPTRTMKETDARIEELSRENYKLKLKLFFLEQQKRSMTSLNSGSSCLGSTNSIPQLQRAALEDQDLSKELLKKNATIQRLNIMFNEKDEELDIMRSELEQLKADSEKQLKNCRQENQQLKKQLRFLQNKCTKEPNTCGEVNEKEDLKMEVNKLRNELKSMEISSQNNANKAKSMEKYMNEQDLELNRLKAQSSQTNDKSADTTLTTYKFMLDEKNIELDAIKQELNNWKTDKFKQYEMIVEQKDKEIVRLKHDLNQMMTQTKPSLDYPDTGGDNNDGKSVYKTFENQSKTFNSHLFGNSEIILNTYRKLLSEKENQIEQLKQKLQNIQNDCNEETLEAYKFMLIEKEQDMENLKKDYEQRLNDKQNVIEKGIRERERLMVELETYKAKKDQIEKAITRQLKKTDRLLKKAKINLIET